MDKYYTCAEVAKLYGVKVSTVWSWIRDGKLECVKVGQRYRVKADNLSKFEVAVNDEN